MAVAAVVMKKAVEGDTQTQMTHQKTYEFNKFLLEHRIEDLGMQIQTMNDACNCSLLKSK